MAFQWRTVASLAQDKNSLPEVAANARTQSVCPGTKHNNLVHYMHNKQKSFH